MLCIENFIQGKVIFVVNWHGRESNFCEAR
jgi:hypothetical protein